MDVNLNTEERELLNAILEEQHFNLLHEIFTTERHEAKTAFQSKEKVLEGILDKFGVTVRARLG